MSDPLTGRALGEYTLGARIGAGTSGAVYRARQRGLDRDVVIKVLRGGGDPEAFLREARTAAQLDHPYAAHVYGFGVGDDGVRWIAFELVEGTTLGALLAAQGPLPLDRAVPLVEKLAEVVHTAHERGIVHRDLSPGNVMILARAGRLLPKILDLGLARADGVAGTGGTPAYMAPEQWRDEPVRGAADVYALALLTWEVLAGSRPFPERDSGALRLAHAERPLPPLPPHLPAPLHAVLLAGSAKAAADRPTPLALAAALREAAGLGSEVAPLPALDEGLRRRAVTELPQPLAEAVARLEEARHVPEVLAAVRRVSGAAAQLLGVLALASASRGPRVDGAVDPLRALAQRDPSPRDWLGLTAALAEPYAALPDSHPLPELVLLFAPGIPAAARALEDALEAAQRRGWRDDDEGRAGVAELLEHLGAWLGALLFLAEVPLAVARPGLGRAERWVGLRRQPRRSGALAAAGLVEGEPLLLDADGHPLLRLAPLAVIAPPAAGAPDELFLFAGPGRHGARLEAPPHGFVRHEDGVWDWLATHVAPLPHRAADRDEDEQSPYPGLAPFAVTDASLFVGRERDSEEALNRLRQLPLLAVVGRSGAGKSSFVHAGLLAAMAAEGGWRWCSLRPGSAPLAELERALAARPVEPGVTWVVVVDQLEELFTLCDAPAQRRAFAARLAGLLDDGVKVVVTLRDDFLARCETLPGFRRRLAQALLLVDTPAPAELRRILAEPPRRLGYAWEDPAIVDEMVAAVADQPGALALISFAGAALWAQRDRHFRLLRRRAYETLGGITGALVRHAEATFDGLVAEEQRALRALFRQLVTAEGTRAPAPLRELVGLERLVERLVAARLLVVTETADGDQIEVIHEALLSAWPRVATWLTEDAGEARRREQLRHAARLWDARGRSRGLLWRDDALLELELWRRRTGAALNDLEAAFAAASAAEAGRGRRLRLGLFAVALIGLVTGLGILWQANRRTEAAQARAEASAADSERLLVGQYVEAGRRFSLEGDPPRALPYLVEAYRRGAREPATRTLLARALAASGREQAELTGHTDGLLWVAIDPAGTRIVTTSSDGTARLWRADGAPLGVLVHPGGMSRAAFSPDGRTVLTAAGSSLRLWDAASAGLLREWTVDDGFPFRVAFSPDGRRLVAAGVRGGLAIVDLAPGTLLQRPAHAARINGLASRERDVVLGSADGTVSVWSYDGRELRRLAGHSGPVLAIAVGPGGSPIVSGSLDGTVRVWDEGRSEARLVLSGHVDGVHDVDVSPRGDRIAAAAGGGTVHLWELPSGAARGTLSGHRGLVVKARFSPDGTQLLSVSYDGLALIWDPDAALLSARLVGHEGALRHGLFFPDGSRVITVSLDRTARIWPTTPTEVSLGMPGPPPRRTALGAITASVRSGDRILTGAVDGHVRVRDAVTGRLRLDLPVGKASVLAIAASPERIVAASDRTVLIFDGAGKLEGPLLGPSTRVFAVALSSDGAIAATLGGDEILTIWDARRREAIGVLRGIHGDLRFLPGDAVLAVHEASGRTREVALPREDRAPDAVIRDAGCRSPYRLEAGQLTTPGRRCP